jgi:hypothetical protein
VLKWPILAGFGAEIDSPVFALYSQRAGYKRGFEVKGVLQTLLLSGVFCADFLSFLVGLLIHAFLVFLPDIRHESTRMSLIARMIDVSPN